MKNKKPIYALRALSAQKELMYSQFINNFIAKV